MEIIIAIIIIIAGTAIWFSTRGTGLDVNNDGKIDLQDVKAAADKIVEGVKSTADVNKDGKVDVADVKAAATKAKTRAKKTVAKAATKVKAAAKKAPGRKPKAK